MWDESELSGARGHTSGRMSSRMEVVGRVSGRRRWTVEQKLAILRDAFGPGGSVREACEQHDVGSGQIYIWRRRAMSGELTGVRSALLPTFAEVEVAVPSRPTGRTVGDPAPCGQISIELPSGVRLTVDAAIDVAALARVLGVLPR